MKPTVRTASLLAIILTLMLTGCTKKEFTVTFSLDPPADGNYRVVCFAADKRGARPVETIASLQQGKAELTLPCLLPTLLYIIPTTGSTERPLAIYAEKGDKISITGSGNHPAVWIADGSETNRELTAWRINHSDALLHGSAETLNKAVADYVAKHPDSRASLIMMLTTFDRAADEPLFRKLWQKLDKKLRTPEILAIAARADLLATVPAPGKSIGDAVTARLLDDSLVTLRHADAQATLYWFRTASDRDGKDDADSLRRYFRRHAPDSVRLATVAFDADSLAMRRSVRLDSIPKAFPLWEPEGAAGKLATRLSVGHTPYYIVVDRKGNTLYRGDNATKALSTLRKLR